MVREKEAKAIDRKTVALLLLLLTFVILDSLALYQIWVREQGNAFDLYQRWLGARAMLFHGQNPYSQEVTHEIQLGMYGRLAREGEDQQAFAYPAYVAFVILFFVLLPFPVAVTLWLVSQQFWLLASVVLILRWLKWSVKTPMLLVIATVTMLYRYSIIVLLIGQFSILVLFLLATALWAYGERRYLLAGACLALTTIKPQLVFLLIPVWLAWAIIRRQWTFLASFGSLMALLLIVPWFFVRDWIGSFFSAMQSYRGYSSTFNPLERSFSLLLSAPAASLLAVVVSLALLAYLLWIIRRAVKKGTNHSFHLVMSVATLVTLLVTPETSVYNMVLIFLPALFCLRHLHVGQGVTAKLLTLATWSTLVLIPWLSWIIRQSFPLDIDLVLSPALLLAILIYVERNLGEGHPLWGSM